MHPGKYKRAVPIIRELPVCFGYRSYILKNVLY